jgi:diguanylate cyclase (GGDEF)-like protein
MDPILEAMPVASLWMVDGAVREMNAAAVALIGCAPEEVLGSILDADRAALVAAAESLADAAGPVTITVRSAEGPPRRWFSVTLGPHPDGGVIAVFDDTSELHRLDATVAELATGVYTTDANVRGQWMPQRLAMGMGIDAELFKGIDIYALVHPDDVESSRALVIRAMATPGVNVMGMMRVLHPEHLDAYYTAAVHATWLPHDDALGGLLIRFDTGVIDGELGASEAEELGTLTLRDASPLGFMNVSLSGGLVQRTARAREILRPVGIKDDATDWMDHVRPEDAALVRELLAEAHAGRLHPPVDVGFAGNDARVWVRFELVPYRGPSGEVAGTFVHLLDITDEHEARLALADAREQLWHQARHDALTGLSNRVPFVERLAAMFAPSTPVAASCAVFVCDLDGFKAINDTYGHGVGDDVLHEVARRLERVVREGDTLCRYGGDEFLILCEGVTAAEVGDVAERIVAAVSDSVVVGGVTHRIGVSVGVAMAHPGEVADADDLVRRADQAMYRAKTGGGHRAVVA